jgi:hypothetical protein
MARHADEGSISGIWEISRNSAGQAFACSSLPLIDLEIAPRSDSYLRFER